MVEKRIEKLEHKLDVMEARMGTSSEKQVVIETKLEAVIQSIKDLKEAVEKLTQAPAEKWKSITNSLMILIIGTMVGAILSAVLKGVIR